MQDIRTDFNITFKNVNFDYKNEGEGRFFIYKCMIRNELVLEGSHFHELSISNALIRTLNLNGVMGNVRFSENVNIENLLLDGAKIDIFSIDDAKITSISAKNCTIKTFIGSDELKNKLIQAGAIIG